MGLKLKQSTKVSGNVILTFMAVLALVMQPMYGLVASQVARATTEIVTNQQELEDAIGGTKAIIQLGDNFSVDKKVSVNRPVMINGEGYTITSTRNNSENNNSNNAVLGIDETTGVTVSNLIVTRGAGLNIHGINVWRSTATLNDVEISGFNNGGTKYGLIVGENSTVTAHNITTSGNSRGINVDKGTPKLIVTGESNHGEDLAIYSDKPVAVHVDDVNGQYRRSDLNDGHGYRLKDAPLAPTITSPINNSTQITKDVTVTWNAPATSPERQDVEFYIITSISDHMPTNRVDADQPLELTYTNLADGQYTVHVRAFTASGLIGGEATSTFTINSHDSALPEITALDAYYAVGTDYTSITADFSTTEVTDATAIEVRVHRVGGETYSIYATPSTVAAINAAADPTKTSAPVVIAGSRTSNSWTNQTGTWSGEELPESVEVIITMADDSTITRRDNDISSRLATWDQVKPVAPIVTTDIHVSEIVNGKFTVSGTAKSTDGNMNRVYVQLVNRLDSSRVGGTTVNLIPLASSTTPWSVEYKIADLPNSGNYAAHVEATNMNDKRGKAGWTDNFHVQVPVRPIVESVDPGEESFISGSAQRININVADSSVVSGGFLQLNKTVASGNPINDSRTNYPMKKDEDGQWFVIIDTKNIVPRNGTEHAGDGKYLFKVEAHGFDGVQHGYYGNSAAWQSSDYYFIVDNTAPEVTSVSLNQIITVGGVNYTGTRLNGGKLSVTFTTNEPLRLVGSQVGFRIPDFAGPPATGWTPAELVSADTNTYVAHIDLINRTDTKSTVFTPDFFAGKTLSDISLYFRTVDVLGNTDSKYYLANGNMGKTLTGLYKFTLDNTNPLATVSVSPLTNNYGRKTLQVTGLVDSAEKNIQTHWFEIKGPGLPANGKLVGDVYDSPTVSRTDNEYIFDWDTTGLNGTYTIRYVATDKVGNRNDCFQGASLGCVNSTANIEVRIDNENPDIKILNMDAINPTSFDVEATDAVELERIDYSLWTDNNTKQLGVWGAQISGTEFTNDGNSITQYTENVNNTKHNFADLPDGEYTLRATVRDMAGNTRNAESFAFIVDHTPPTLTISNETTTHNDIPYFKTAREVQVDVEDSNIGVTRIYKADGTEVLASQNYTDASFKLAQGLPEGEYYIVHTDEAGNKSEQVRFIVANTGPEIQNVQIAPFVSSNTANTQQISFDVSTNGGTEINKVTYKINKYDESRDNNRGTQVVTGEVNNTEYLIDLSDVMSKLNDGERYVIELRANNIALVHDIKYFEFTVDKTAPTATFSYSNNNGNTLTQDDVTVTMTTSEPIQTPADWINMSDTEFTRVYDSNGKREIVITDLAGNTSDPQKFEVKRIDRNEPTISGVNDGDSVEGPVTLSIFDPKYEGFDGFDKNSGLTINGVAVPTTDGPDKTYLYTISEPGEYVIVATDKAGNATQITFTITTPTDEEGNDDDQNGGDPDNGTDPDDDNSGDGGDEGSGPDDGAGGSDTPGGGTQTPDPDAENPNDEDEENGDQNESPTASELLAATQPSFVGILNGNTTWLPADSDDDESSNPSPIASSRGGSVSENGDVLAAEDTKDSWSLINLLLTIGIGLISIVSLLGLVGTRRKDRKVAARLMTIVPAAGAIVALLLIEDFSGQMNWVNIWSLLIAGLMVVQMIIRGSIRSAAREE